MKRFSMFRAIASIFILSIVLTAVSCSKEGDAGPAGKDGTTGPAGPAGPTGPKGDQGNANIIASDWLNIGFEEDTAAAGNFVAGIEATELTPEVLTTGEVHVYMNLNNAADPVIVPLPYFDGRFIINLRLVTGGFFLLANEDLSSFQDTDGAIYQQARYVVIPANAAGRKANIDWNDYKAVKKYLNLKD